MGGKKKRVTHKPKKSIKGHVPSKKYSKYNVNGDSVNRSRYCPRCGPGVFLANHSNRFVCGKCGYVEIK